MVRDGRSCPARQVGNLELDVRTNDLGCPVLYFPFMSCSDIHLGTKHSRAKRLCHMLEHTTTDTFFFVGGIIDVIGLKKKETSNWGPWQRQVIGHVLRKTSAGTQTQYIWKELGLDPFCGSPTSIEDEYTDKVDRLLRLIYRIAPPRDRQHLVADMAVKAL